MVLCYYSTFSPLVALHCPLHHTCWFMVENHTFSCLRSLVAFACIWCRSCSRSRLGRRHVGAFMQALGRHARGGTSLMLWSNVWLWPKMCAFYRCSLTSSVKLSMLQLTSLSTLLPCMRFSCRRILFHSWVWRMMLSLLVLCLPLFLHWLPHLHFSHSHVRTPLSSLHAFTTHEKEITILCDDCPYPTSYPYSFNFRSMIYGWACILSAWEPASQSRHYCSSQSAMLVMTWALVKVFVLIKTDWCLPSWLHLVLSYLLTSPLLGLEEWHCLMLASGSKLHMTKWQCSST